MATVKENETARLTVKVESGVDESGKAKYSARSITDLDPALGDDDARTIGELYGGLQAYPVSAIVRQVSAVLVEE